MKIECNGVHIVCQCVSRRVKPRYDTYSTVKVYKHRVNLHNHMFIAIDDVSTKEKATHGRGCGGIESPCTLNLSLIGDLGADESGQ